MSFRYLEHVGDAAVEASGRTLEEAFSEAARAMFTIMVRGGAGAPGKTVAIVVRGESLDELLATFLNELLAQQGLNDLIFTECAVREIRREGPAGYILRASASGTAPEALRGRLGAEVKAASYLGLKVACGPGRCTARCVLDM